MMLAVLALAMLATAPSALAKNYAPPGKAGTSQYAEDIPSGGGNVSTPAMGTANKSSAQIDKIGAGKAGVRKLAKLGKTGEAAAQFAQETAPTTTVAAAPTKAAPTKAVVTGKPGIAAGSRVFTASGGSAVSGVGKLIGGSDAGGIGIFLPLLLILCLIGAAAAGVARLRNGHSEPQS